MCNKIKKIQTYVLFASVMWSLCFNTTYGANPDKSGNFCLAGVLKRILKEKISDKAWKWRRFFSKRLKEEKYLHRLKFKLPEKSPLPGIDIQHYVTNKYFDDGRIYSTLDEIKEYFKSKKEYYQFLQIARKNGFEDGYDLALWLDANGRHRGIKIILNQFKQYGTSPTTKQSIMKLGDRWGTKLSFKYIPEVKIFRGTNLTEPELNRLFKLNWEDYFESYNRNIESNLLDNFSGGKYFTVDEGIAQHFAIYKHNRSLGDKIGKTYPVIVEARVPQQKLSKSGYMANWNVTEVQYDPEKLTPKNLLAFRILLPRGNSIRIPADLLRNKRWPEIHLLLKKAGMPKKQINLILKGL